MIFSKTNVMFQAETDRWAAGGGGEMIILKKRDRPQSIQDTNTNAIYRISQEDPTVLLTAMAYSTLTTVHSHTQRGRRLEGWSKTTAHLAG
jgi:hypothetical protein